jgi:hypothetical protein
VGEFGDDGCQGLDALFEVAVCGLEFGDLLAGCGELALEGVDVWRDVAEPGLGFEVGDEAGVLLVEAGPVDAAFLGEGDDGEQAAALAGVAVE